MQKPHVLVIDGMALLFRSFFATAMSGNYFINDKGLPTNAVQGFARHVFTAREIFSPSHIVVTWDKGMHTFRNDLFDGYKINRPAPPQELVPQFDMAQELSKELGWINLGVVGMEADDTIASVLKKWQGEAQFTVVSGDKDLLQLLRPDVTLQFTKKGFSIYDTYHEQRFREEYGIAPQQFPDVKAFMGDSSDGYPGVKGIGPKTALQLIQAYGNVDGVLASLHELKPGQRKKIEEAGELLHVSKQLAVIRDDVPIDVKLDALYWEHVPSTANDYCHEFGYRQVLRHFA